MEFALDDSIVPIEYDPKVRTYAVDYLDGGNSVYVLDLCPFCGARLPSRLGEAWVKQLSRLGIEPGDHEVPAEMDTDTWWRGTELDDWTPTAGSALATGKQREVSPVRRDINDAVLPHACERMAYAVGEDDLPITYAATVGVYAIEYQDTGEKGLMIEFCPFCGAHLPTG